MYDLSFLEWGVLVFAAILIGISKTGMPTLGILVVVTLATLFPARDAIGIVLPMLITADLVAVTYYRRHVNWKILIKMIPWVVGGLTIGFITLFYLSESRPIEVILGFLIISMVMLQILRDRSSINWEEILPNSKLFTGIMGTLGGFTTMVGNAAGPVMAVFLVALQLPKAILLGTGAWFFLSVNLIKVPLYSFLGLITAQSLLVNLMMIPAILFGTLIGIRLVPIIPQQLFQMIILLLALAGGLNLLF